MGDTLSRTLYVSNTTVGNDIEALFIQLDDVIGSYEEDPFSAPIVRAVKDDWLRDQKKRGKPEKWNPLFQLDGKGLLYNRNLCVPRKSISTIMHMAPDSKTRGHFKFAKTMARLDNFH